ncbi:MAG: SIS domain-containing protein [Lachnospiraceae bacterium]
MYLDYKDRFIQALNELAFYRRNEENPTNDYEEAMEELLRVFSQVKQKNKKVFFAGNGGSAAIASHMTIDFMKNGRVSTCNLYDGPTITCLGNDYGYETIFSKQLDMLGQEGDLLVAISSSGNSPNIIQAIRSAREKGMEVITFSGFLKENQIHNLGCINVHVPLEEYGIVESIHNVLLQQLVDELRGEKKDEKV